jgi:hypothetical protein
VGHAVEPVGDYFPWHDGSGLAHEDQEGDLESVLGVVLVLEDPAAHAPYHRTMPAHNRCQRCLVMAAHEVFKELAVGQPRSIAAKHRPSDVLDNLARLAARHVVSLVRATFALYTYYYPHSSVCCIFSQQRGSGNQPLETSAQPPGVPTMSENFQTEPFNPFKNNSSSAPSPQVLSNSSPLPDWLARRLLRQDENVAWVRGPRLNPSWERYITHPALFLVAVALGFVIVWVVRQATESGAELRVVSFFVAFGIAIATIFVLGFSAGYFTRLVVTNLRVVILQGYEVCDYWSIDQLPPSLLRFDRRDGQKASASVDLNALQTALGGSPTQFVEAKTILAFGKHLNRIKLRDKDATDRDQTLPQN